MLSTDAKPPGQGFLATYHINWVKGWFWQKGSVICNGWVSVYKGRLSKKPYYKRQLLSSQRYDSRGAMSHCLPPHPVPRSSTMSYWPFVMPASNWKRTTSLGSLTLWCRNAIIPAFFVLTRMSEWVRDWGSHPPSSCLPSLNMEEALEINLGLVCLSSQLLSFLCHLLPFFPFSPPALIVTLPSPSSLACRHLYRPAPREGKENYYLLNFSYMSDTVQGVFLTAALWGRYYYYFQFNLRKLKWLTKVTQLMNGEIST